MAAYLFGLLRVVPADQLAGWRGAGILGSVIASATIVYWLAAHLLGAPEPAELRRVARRGR